MAKPNNTVESLIEAARGLVHHHSYNAMTVEDICEASGVLKGSFYHFFKSKHDLMLAVLERERQLCLQALFAPAFSQNLAPLARIEKVFDLLYQQQHRAQRERGKLPGCLIGNLALEMSTQDEVLRGKAREIFEDFERYFTVALSSAVETGELKQAMVGVLAQQLVAYLEGVLLIAKVNNDPELIRLHGKGAVALARQGAVAPASRARRRKRRNTTSP